MYHDAAGAPVEPLAARRAGRAAARARSGRRRGRVGGGRAAPGVLAAVAAGGMVGASARYGLARAFPARSGGIPWATLGANLAGSFLLGLLLVLLLERFPPSRYLRPFLATGILGSFTTMSTYQLETALLIKDGHPLTGAVYGLGSLAAGLAAAYSGILAGRLTPPRRREVTA